MKIIDYARSFIGKPYLYGGKCASYALDCSGFLQEVLSFAGVDIPGDQNAQAYYDHFSKTGTISLPIAGALAFYGVPSKIHHINLITSEHSVIGAMGGDATTTTLEKSYQQRAFVKERPMTWMKDIVAIIMPNYPEWVKEAA